MNKIDEITQIIGEKFCSFGGGHVIPFNPVSTALKDQPFQFAAGVDIKTVVTIIIMLSQDIDDNNTITNSTPAEPEKVKPLVQYLAEYLDYEVVYDVDRELLQQALDAYESTEGVKIRIERV